MARALILVTSLWFIAVGGWLAMPARTGGCAACVPATGFALRLVPLVLGFLSLAAALRMPQDDRSTG